MILKNIKISFGSDKLEKEFSKLRTGRSDEKRLFHHISRAFDDIEKDLNCATKISKRLWSKFYSRHKLTNLWKYDLPDGYRLIFTLEDQEVVILAIILEWFSHKDYKKRFKY